jgi:HlyD family secretion protein
MALPSGSTETGRLIYRSRDFMERSASSAVDTAPARRKRSVATVRRWLPWGIALVLATLIAGAWHYVATRPPPAVHYKTVPVVRRAIIGRVTATGTLSAIVTVQVGTQVSGRIQRLNVDFNSHVTKGQVVATIDPQLYQATLDQAQANYLAAEAGVQKSESDAHIAERQYTRTKALFGKALVPQSDLDNAAATQESAQALLNAAKAALAQARAARNQARVNLSYTNIISPIDGVVIQRSVDVGQTVAASLQAPTLFTIAQDLTKMQVDSSVAEADVGRLRVGMPTYFTVDAFPGQRFRGKIREIRNAATMLQNVVTYDAVIDVDNSDLRLRPGMTANVTVVYAEQPSALAIPNAALRFHPPGPRDGGAEGRSSAPGDESDNGHTIWVMAGGSPRSVVVHVGLTDGTVTELLDGDLSEGDEIVVEATEPGADSTASGATAGGGPSRRLF